VELLLGVDALQVLWDYNEKSGGAPNRDSYARNSYPEGTDVKAGTSHAKLAFTLRPNQWGRVTYHGRFHAEDTWLYRNTVLNVGFVTTFDAELFTRNDPLAEYKQVAYLY